MTLRATDLVADPVHQRLAHVGVESALVSRLERLQFQEDLGEGVLDEVLGFPGVACPDRKTPVRPAFQPWQIAGEQIVERLVVPCSCPSQELHRGLCLRGTVGRTGRCRTGRLGLVHETKPLDGRADCSTAMIPTSY